MWIPRRCEPALRRLGEERAVVLVTGARQAGKTALLQELHPTNRYVSLDLPAVAEEAEESGEGFLARHPPPLTIDEVQYAPRLFRFLKSAVDQRRHEHGLYWLTGSQKLGLMQGVPESLAGRIALLELHSLALAEIHAWSRARPTRAQILAWMFSGGYPEIHARGLDPQRFYADYVATYLERDVRQVVQVRSLRDFDRFLRLAATRTGQLLSMSSLASDVGVSPNTIKSWVSVLEASNVVFLLEPYYRNLGKRIVKTPKLYFLDTGLACFLAGFRGARDLEASGLLGAFFETLVLGQIVRWYADRALPASVYFYRDHHGHEVDFVVPVGKRLKLVEAKWSESPPERVSGFDEVYSLLGERGVISATLVLPSAEHPRRTRAGYDVASCLEPSFLAS